jgi:hypothetical protein
MMCGGYPQRWLPHRRANIGAKDFPCLKKLTPSARGSVSIALADFIFVLHDRELAALLQSPSVVPPTMYSVIDYDHDC